MGMFDMVKFEMKCPTCGNLMNDFQTKDLSCMLDKVSVNEVINFYSFCSKCDTWIEFIRKPKDKIPTLDEVKEDFFIEIRKVGEKNNLK